MFSMLLTNLMATIFAFFDAVDIKDDIDNFLDGIEAKAEAKPDSLKKTALLGMLGSVRKVIGVPDDYNGDPD